MGNVNARCDGGQFCGELALLTIPCVLVVSYIARVLFYWCHRRRHIDPDSPTDHDSASLPRPLDPKIVESIPVIVCGESAAGSAECVICLSEIEEGKELRVLPNCTHEFHVLCIDRWFLSASTCPLCRAVVEMPDSDGKTPSESRPRPPMLMLGWTGIVALVFSRWALIRDFILQRRQGLEAESDLELGERPGTSRHSLPAPLPPPSPHS